MPRKHKKNTILVVDDEENIREMLRRHFLFINYDVFVAKNGRDALDLMSEKKIDIIISDIKMPVMDGIQLLREARKGFPMTHTIMITGYVTMDNVLACMRLGADACIFKPMEDISELEKAVKHAATHIRQWETTLKTLLEMKPIA